MSRQFALALLLFATALGVSCDADDPVAAPPSTLDGSRADLPGRVTVQGVAFHPRTIAVSVGDQVTWTFDDGGLAHTVTADDGSFGSDEQSEGTFVQTFSEAGTFAYHCELHAAMHGVVTVEAVAP